jgi:hypothetical protein
MADTQDLMRLPRPPVSVDTITGIIFNENRILRDSVEV